MKFVQIGILAALLVVAGLLYKVYQGQSAQPAPATTAQTQPQPAPVVQNPAPADPAPSETKLTPDPEPVAAPAPEPVEHAKKRPPAHKPSPAAPARHKSEPAEMAQNTPPPQMPAPAPAGPAAQPSSPEPPQQTALNPPSRPETPPPPPPRQPQTVTIPAGTTLSVRLGENLTTEKNAAGDSFTGTLDQPLIIDGMAIAERGARVEGRVVEAERAGRVKGLSHIAIQLTKLHTSDGQNVAVKTESFQKEGVASRGDDVKKVGLGAALGAAIGALAGGGKGAAIGAGVGGAAGTGTVMATRGKDVVLPVETRLPFRLQEPLTLTEKLK